MLKAALLSLAHDRGKLVASLAGVAFASSLLLVQLGLYVGFRETSSSLIRSSGGDLWVMSKGTEVLDNAEVLSPESRLIAASHPCVRDVRGLVMAYLPLRKPSGARDYVLLVGLEPRGSRIVPWRVVEGLPMDLDAPMRVSVDRTDLGKLQLPRRPIGAALEVGGKTVRVAVVTEGIRSFTLSPYLFAEMATARQLHGIGEGQAHYWIVDLRDPGCLDDVVQWVERQSDLTAVPTEQWTAMTADYWVGGSGAGMALAFSAALGLIVGCVIVGQALYSTTKDHQPVLATLKAVGASGTELVGFVAWQVLCLCFVGCLSGSIFAVLVQHAVADLGLLVVLSPEVIAAGAVSVVAMCITASALSIRFVLTLDPAEVFR